MSQKIADLEIVIHDQASEAATKVDNLADAAKRLGDTSKGVKDVANGMSQLDKAAGKTGADKLKTAVASIEENVKSLSDALDQAQKKISSFGNTDIKTNIPEVGKQAESIKSATKGAADGIKEVSDKAEEAKSSTDRFSSALGYAGKALHNMRNILPGIVTQLGRMLKMRILRTIVKNFLAGVTEGLQNVYNWASLVGNGFKATMDGMASSALYLKNSIGAAFASLVSLVAPHINNLIDLIVEGINYVNMFFAVLGGKSTYTRAKKVAVEYGKAAESAIGGAAGAAKELKETLSVLDFDELNQLADQPTPSTGGGGGGGGGTPGTDVADMFETANITSNALTKAAMWIKENFDDVLDIVTAIGAGILAWKFSNAFLGDVLSLRQLAGIAIAVTGFTLEFEGAKAIGKGNADFMDWLKAGIGAALGIAGSLMTFGLTPAGFLIGIGLAITMFITGVTVGKMEAFREQLMLTSDDYKFTASIVEQSTERINKANSRLMQVKLQSPMDNEEYKKWSYAADLLKKIQGFEGVKADKANLGELQAYIDELNGILEAAGLDAFVQYWIDANGEIQTNAKNIQEVIDKMLELSRLNALKDLISENLKGIYEAETENRTYRAENERSQSIIDQYQPTIDAYDERMKQGRIYLTDDEEKELTEAQLQVEQATAAIEKNNEAMSTNLEYIAQAAELNRYYEEELYGVTTAVLGLNEVIAAMNLAPVQNAAKLISKTGANAALDAAFRTQIWGAGQTEVKAPVKVDTNLFTDPNLTTYTNGLADSLDGVSVATNGVTDSANGMNGVWTNFTTTAGGGVINTTEIMSNEFGALGKTMQSTTADANTATYAYRQIGTGMQVVAIRKDFQSNLAPVYFSDTATKAKNAFESEINTTKADKNKIVPQIINPIQSGDYAGTGSAIRTAVQGAVNAITANGGTIYRSINSQITGQNYGVPGATISKAVQYEVNKTTADGGKIYRNIDSAIYAQPFSKTGGQVGADLQSGIYYGFSSKTICGAIFDGMKKAMASLPFSQIGVSMGNDIKSGIAWSLQGAQLYVQMVVGNRRTDMYGRVSAASLYAMGGFPQAGSVFIAGEQGAEAVGTINGRTGVANRDQIASAIAMALQPMLGSGGSTTTNVNVNMDSRSVARASLKGQRAMNRQFNITAQA